MSLSKKSINQNSIFLIILSVIAVLVIIILVNIFGKKDTDIQLLKTYPVYQPFFVQGIEVRGDDILVSTVNLLLVNLILNPER